jgi:hypothetical protein
MHSEGQNQISARLREDLEDNGMQIDTGPKVEGCMISQEWLSTLQTIRSHVSQVGVLQISWRQTLTAARAVVSALALTIVLLS